MGAQLHEIESALAGLLRPDQVDDYCPNGLQVEGRPRVATLVTGVTACQALLDAAVEAGADALLVHHGYFWKGEDPRVRGIRRRRLATLLGAEMSLFAYHLPLDMHAELGNNAQLAAQMDWKVTGGLQAGKPPGESIGLVGECDPVSGAALGARIGEVLGREPLHVPGARSPVRTIGWCTGAAQDFIDDAIDQGLDAYVTGEVSEQTVHAARENGIHFYAAGHHATERYGVQAVGEWLAGKFALDHRFIDIDNPA